MEEDKEVNNKEKIIEIGVEDIRIPDCCQEGWESCPHVAPKLKKIKKNIGL